MFFKRELNGIDEIRKYLGLSSSSMTVSDWHKGYDLPIRKESGIWKANKRELKKWLREHKYLLEEMLLPEPRAPALTTQIVRGRFGLIKYKLMNDKKVIKTWKI